MIVQYYVCFNLDSLEDDGFEMVEVSGATTEAEAETALAEGLATTDSGGADGAEAAVIGSAAASARAGQKRKQPEEADPGDY